ncbi:SusC/RagA family TonB-linked outer membrane protein [Flavobacterium ajazii]|uniref:SusC/RagA family TonB-linked outer membrane protein n=1 Tax=Flavobacterium ajazii TaxID=2692318 RepID=UPI001FE768FD|nr:SusC/RagA family TonB-linked outer membrane protein [Flavobacterium ajazii]
MKKSTIVSFPGREKIIIYLMRTFIFLFCSTVFGFVPSDVFSQKTKVTIDADKTVTVNEVLEILSSQTDYNFIFEANYFKNAPKVKLKKGTVNANDLLEKCLPDKSFDLTITKDNTIIIKPKSNISSAKKPIEAQRTIKGKVIDKNGMPLVGATVKIKGSQTAVVTDFSGQYSIEGKTDDILIISYLGFATQEIKIDNKSEFNVVLIEESNTLNEIKIVSTGFQEISKERSTGSYQNVGKEQLEKPSSSIAERLVGSIAGMQSKINADGSIEFQIRGQSSLFADAQPLIVLDGFPIEGGFNSINPNDIESVTVLKDAAAASIWGAKSANGVIVLTSKKAKKGQTKVSFSSFMRISPKLDVDYATSLASSKETIEYEQMAFDTDNFYAGWPYSESPTDYFPRSLAMTAMIEANLGRISTAERDATLNRLGTLNNKDQIEKYLLQTPITRQYNFNIAGGSEKMKNNLSLLYEDNKTFFIGDKSSKYQVDFSNVTNLNKFIDFNFAGMLQYRNIDANSSNSFPQYLYGGQSMLDVIKGLAPWDMLVDGNGNYTDMSYLKYYMPNVNAFFPLDKFAYSDWSYNPITEVQNRDFNTEQLNTRIQAGLDFKIIDGLTFNSKIQYQIFKSEANNYSSDKTFAVRNFINASSEYYFDDSKPIQNVPSGGILQSNTINNHSYNFRNQLNFNRTFKDLHSINFIAGSEISNLVVKTIQYPDQFGYDPERLTGSQLLNPYNTSYMWWGDPLSYAQYLFPFNVVPVTQQTERTTRYVSMFSNLGYTYDKRYTVTGSYRTDASNFITEDPKMRYDPFWSVGASWNIANENFLSNSNTINRLMLRATYGFNGNLDNSISVKPLLSRNTALDNVTLEPKSTFASFGNPDLRWEKTENKNIGVDFGLFNNKFFGSVDLYHKRGYDLIVNQSIAAVNGTTSQKLNNGEMINKGIEVILGTSLPITKNIGWDASFNFAYNKNEITDFFVDSYFDYNLNGSSGDPTYSYVQGYNANTIWSYQYAGMHNFGTEADPNIKPAVIGANNQLVNITSYVPGDARTFLKPQGTSVAPYNIGMRNSFKIYDFDLSFIVTAKWGHVFRRQGFNYPTGTEGNSGANSNYSEVVNSDPNQIVPISTDEFRYFFYPRLTNNMDYLTADASHIRFQEVNLTYSLDKRVISMIGLDSFNLFVQANNLGTILFNKYGEDPEYPRGGLKLQRSLILGFNFNF